MVGYSSAGEAAGHRRGSGWVRGEGRRVSREMCEVTDPQPRFSSALVGMEESGEAGLKGPHNAWREYKSFTGDKKVWEDSLGMGGLEERGKLSRR
ncbi:hypothetical protein Pcinc_008609 [Petrolisthes cinctipes]|uniref:Uncharacterized protein n=1 Tax=Petrolisthes cinctipes TaxID=88211 RepID=A0AAE1GCV2_PETCI|nr:hypothetical protein Pcinc_008609 [Petrolisthes cinctipes]